MFDLNFYNQLSIFLYNVLELPAIKTEVITNRSILKNLKKKEYEEDDILEISASNDRSEYLYYYLKYFNLDNRKISKTHYRNHFY